MRVLFLLLFIISCNSEKPELSALNKSSFVSYPYIAFPDSDSYSLNETLHFTVHYKNPTTATLSRVAFKMDSSAISSYANLTSGNGTKTHTYSYTVVSGDEDIDGIQFEYLDLGGGAIVDKTGFVEVSFPAKLLTGVKVDSTPPTVSSIIPQGKSGTFLINEYVEIVMNFSEAVKISGTPRFNLSLQFGGTKYATYYAGSGTSEIRFRYKISNGDQDLNGIIYNKLVEFNGGTIKDLAGNPLSPYADGPIPVPAVKIDAKAPQIVFFTTNARAYKPTTSINLTLTFDEPVIRAAGTSIDFQIKPNGEAPGTARSAVSFTPGSTSTISYSYTFQSGDVDFDGFQLDTGSLSLNGTELKDSVGNHAILTIPASDTFSRSYAVPTSMSYWFDVSDPTTIGTPSFGTVPTNFFSKTGGLTGNINSATFEPGFNGTTLPYLRFGSGSFISFSTSNVFRYAVLVHRTPIASAQDKTVFKDIDGTGDLQLTIKNDGGLYGGVYCSTFCRYYDSWWSDTVAGVFPALIPANSPIISVVEFDGPGGLGVNSVRLQIGGGDYDGDIAEVIFFSDDPTTVANGEIHKHLKAKYNVDFAGP